MRLNLARRAPVDAQQQTGERKSGGLLRLILVVLALAWAVRSLLFAPFSIPSGSMLPNLFIGDYVVVAKWPYGYSRHSFLFGVPPIEGRLLADLPERGDIVVFRSPGTDEDFVKRVIGLPGDTVALQAGMLILNGEPIPREPDGRFAMQVSANSPCRVVPGATPMTTPADGGEACLYPVYRETLPGGRSYRVIDQVDNPRADHIAGQTVPAGHLFLMGDNRDDSLDSRFSPAEAGTGLVPVENLIGRAAMIFWSTDGSAHYLKPWTWFSALRTDRLGKTFGNPPR